MKTVYSRGHAGHAPESEFFRGNLVECFERPERAFRILREVRRRNLGEVIEPTELPPSGFDPALFALIEKVHSEEYVRFVRTIYHDWCDLLARDDDQAALPRYILPHTFDRLGRDAAGLGATEPVGAYGRLGFYSFDACTPITAGTWDAALAAR